MVREPSLVLLLVALALVHDSLQHAVACFPNVARFDYFDSPGDGNTRFHFRVRAAYASLRRLVLRKQRACRRSTRFRKELR